MLSEVRCFPVSQCLRSGRERVFSQEGSGHKYEIGSKDLYFLREVVAEYQTKVKQRILTKTPNSRQSKKDRSARGMEVRKESCTL